MNKYGKFQPLHIHLCNTMDLSIPDSLSDTKGWPIDYRINRICISNKLHPFSPIYTRLCKDAALLYATCVDSTLSHDTTLRKMETRDGACSDFLCSIRVLRHLVLSTDVTAESNMSWSMNLPKNTAKWTPTISSFTTAPNQPFFNGIGMIFI